MTLRSLLFVPADRAQAYFTTMAAGDAAGPLPDAVILDLEDSVAAHRKSAARGLLGGVLDECLHRVPPSVQVLVRINGVLAPEFGDDLAAVQPWVGQGVGVMVPKCASGADLDTVMSALPALTPGRLVPLVETLDGLRQRDALMTCCRQRGVGSLAFGAGDMSLELGIDRDYSLPLLQQVVVQLVLSAKMHGLNLIDAPSRVIPTAAPGCALAARLEAECRWARANGLTGKLAVHPGQIGFIHAAFDRSDRVAWARRVLADFAQAPDGRAVRSSIDGSYMGTPTWKQAQAILAAAARDGADR